MEGTANKGAEKAVEYHMPVRPYGLIDAINRRSAAIGSVGYAMACSNASYNGHHVSVTWNSYRGYYVAEHYWGERVVHARGTIEACIRAALREYDRGDLGASVAVYVEAKDLASVSADLLARLTPGPITFEADGGAWYAGLVEDAIRRGTTHLLIAADKIDGDKLAAYREMVREHGAAYRRERRA